MAILVRGLIANEAVTAVHDVSDGGLAVALAEMAMAGGIGASIEVSPLLPEHGFVFFGEDQARYVVTATLENADAIRNAAESAGVACEIIGVTGGDTLTLGFGTAMLLDNLMRVHEGWLPGYMEGAPILDEEKTRRIMRKGDTMPMPSSEIERLIKQGIPDAKVEITDLAGDNNHYAAVVVSRNSPEKPSSSSISSSTKRSAAPWVANCMRCSFRPVRRRKFHRIFYAKTVT